MKDINGRPPSYPTGPILEPQDQKIGVIYAVHERCAKDFEALK